MLFRLSIVVPLPVMRYSRYHHYNRPFNRLLLLLYGEETINEPSSFSPMRKGGYGWQHLPLSPPERCPAGSIFIYYKGLSYPTLLFTHIRLCDIGKDDGG